MSLILLNCWNKNIDMVADVNRFDSRGRISEHVNNKAQLLYQNEDTTLAIGIIGNSVESEFLKKHAVAKGKSMINGQFTVANICKTYDFMLNPKLEWVLVFKRKGRVSYINWDGEDAYYIDLPKVSDQASHVHAIGIGSEYLKGLMEGVHMSTLPDAKVELDKLYIDLFTKVVQRYPKISPQIHKLKI